MSKQSSLTWRLELIWWFFTAIILLAVLFPILNKLDNYPFLLINSVFVIVFITFTRYIFLLKHTFLAKRQRLKSIVLVACLPLFFYLINELNFFQTYLDEQGLETFMASLSTDSQLKLASFIRNEMLLFGVGSIFSTILLPLRLIISIWRTHNKGTV